MNTHCVLTVCFLWEKKLPGHPAKYCTYTFYDVLLVLDSKLHTNINL